MGPNTGIVNGKNFKILVDKVTSKKVKNVKILPGF